MKPHKGHYHDAIVNKRIKTVAFIVEAYGGVARRGRAQVASLAERANLTLARGRRRRLATRRGTTGVVGFAARTGSA